MSNIRWFTDPDGVEQQAREQVEQTASMPFVEGLAVMPDVHYGKGSTVGTVVATSGAVMPACVGVDIGCGMIAARTKLPVAAVREKAQAIREGIERRIPVGIGLAGMNGKLHPSVLPKIEQLETTSSLNWGDVNHMNARAKDWRNQLGTLGGGNHFIEVCTGSAIYPPEHDGGTGYFGPEEVWVILHSGSRGVGNKTGTYWTKVAQKQAERYLYSKWLPNPELAYLVKESEEYWQYMKELYWCQQFAHLSRQEMLLRVLAELAYTVARPLGLIEEGGLIADLMLEEINCHHNYVNEEVHGGRKLTITRKGAILAAEGVRGLIPGSMGAQSYIVTGKGNEGAFRSAPHGAGRRMSRNAARKMFTLENVKNEMEQKGIEARVREQIVDEAPGAYKDINMVMWDARELVTPTHCLTQIISVKGD